MKIQGSNIIVITCCGHTKVLVFISVKKTWVFISQKSLKTFATTHFVGYPESTRASKTFCILFLGIVFWNTT